VKARSFAEVRTDELANYVQAILVPNGRYARIRELVTSTDYLAAKAMRVGTQELVEDLRAARRLAPDQNAATQLRHLETALVQSARLVIDEPGQLYGQLLARVPPGTAPDVDKLLEEAARWRDGTWLRPLCTVHGHLYIGSFGPVNGFVDAVAISDDSSVVLVGDRAGSLSAWNTGIGEQLWAGNAGAVVNAVIFRPGSFEALVALGDGTMARWSLADRQLRRFVHNSDHSVAALAVEANSLVYCVGPAIHGYDLATDTLLWRGEHHQSEVTGVTILGDGERCVSVSGDGVLAVWQLCDGRFLKNIGLPADQPLCATAVRDRPLVVLGTRNRRVLLVDVDAGLVTILRGHTNQVRSVAALPDGHVVSGSYDGQMLVWDLTDRSNRRVGVHDRWCLAVAAPRQPGLLVSGSDDGVVRIWEANGPEVPLAKKNKMNVRALVVGAETAYAAVDRAVTRLDLATGMNRPQLTGHRNPVVTLAISSGEKLVSGSYDSDIRLWDVTSGESKVFKGHANGADALILTPDETEIISVSRDATWRRWNLVTGTAGPIVRATEPFNSVVAVSPDGALVVTATQEHTVEVWDRLEGRRVLPPLYGHTGYVECLAITPDGRTLLSGSWDHSLRLWELATGEQRACFQHLAWVTDLVVTSDGRLAITACPEGGIGVFDLKELEPCEPFTGHDKGVWHLALASDDRTLFSIGSGTVRAWDIAARTQLAVFEAEAGLSRIAVAGSDLIVVGTSKGAVIPFRLERDSNVVPA
jgi:WD40 repeat protein